MRRGGPRRVVRSGGDVYDWLDGANGRREETIESASLEIVPSPFRCALSPADDGGPVAVATAAEGAIRGEEVWFALLM
jgi:hypothetical protein